MLTLGPLAFTAPWLLAGLLALPILWLILRAVPPAPIRRRFPGVALLLGLADDSAETDRTPWWLLALRMAALAAAIAGFAGPVLNPGPERPGDGPLLVLLDGTWADARDWPDRIARADALLTEAARAGRPAALATLTDLPPAPPPFRAAGETALALPGLTPRPWEPDPAGVAAFAAALGGSFDTIWLSDGLARDSRTVLLDALTARGSVTVVQTPRQTLGLTAARFAEGAILLPGLRSPAGEALSVDVAAIGADPSGSERVLATAPLAFDPGNAAAEARFDLPPELRNRITRFEITGQRSAAAVALTDDALRRPEVALIAAQDTAEGLDLLSPLHYLRQALAPGADIIEGMLPDVLPANPDVIILADVAGFAAPEAEALAAWVSSGGLLVRFAGPRLAALDPATADADPLLPVRLRAGGRSVGGAMSWGEPRALAPFAETSPFAGLSPGPDVTVSRQVMAQPDPRLADRVIAELADGTPLVTRAPLGQGQIVLFHVTANAEWSNLPLSGLFVQMLERLSVAARAPSARADDLTGTTWIPTHLIDAWGSLAPTDTLAGVAGARLAEARPGQDLPPGLYAGADARIAVNALAPGATISPALWPAGIPVEGLATPPETALKGWLLAAALLLLAADALAALALSGRLRGPRAGAALLALLAIAAAPSGAPPAQAQTQAQTQAQDLTPADRFALQATADVVLAHVLTGDSAVDETARAGLAGLSRTLALRTSVEPAAPMGVNIETDELSLFPFLYWPLTPGQPLPSATAYEKLNRYLRTGGMILFDTRDADLGGFGAATPEGRALQAIAAPLDIPPLEPIPPDHVLTRSFYLLQDFPGRHPGPDLWVEAAPPDAGQAEGMPFRNLNDGVTPVVIGGNDWAAAWAVDEAGMPLYPVGRGTAGDRQREIALRFGVNLIMHVLTGNYKSDQVHVPALLDRLGQ